jgi:hypothetical protein
MMELLPTHFQYRNKQQSRSSAQKRQIAIFRRLFMLFIILVGLFTIAWISALRRRNPINSKSKQTLARFFWQFSGDSEYNDAKASLWPRLTHMIIVPGHAVHTCRNLEDLRRGSCWYLLDYQIGQTNVFISHIQRGIELAKSDPSAMLMFSGGQTRGSVGPVSEASAYFIAGMLMGMDWGIKRRVVLEEYARDSFENLAFSLCRFYQITQKWPEKVTVVGFPFKSARFSELHWPTIKEKLGTNTLFEYVGVGPDENKLIDDAYGPFSSDPLGHNPPLSEKRRQRDPFRLLHPYSSCFSWL